MKNKGTATVLAFLLGGLGVHQFYLGNNTKGILYLIFVWTMIPGILGFIDFLILLLLTEKEFDHKYNFIAKKSIEFEEYLLNNHKN